MPMELVSHPDSPRLMSLPCLSDSRGSSTRLPSSKELGMKGEPYLLISKNLLRGTVRGMHCQSELYPEWKLIFVTSGEILDLTCTVPREGRTLRTETFRLSSDSGLALLVPPNHLHGYQTLCPDTTVQYLIWGTRHSSESRNYNPLSALFLKEWPLDVTIMSEQDKASMNI